MSVRKERQTTKCGGGGHVLFLCRVLARIKPNSIFTKKREKNGLVSGGGGCFANPTFYVGRLSLVGSENVVRYARENLYIVKTLKEFQLIDEDGKDQGSNGI
jgi:hypothetical protein